QMTITVNGTNDKAVIGGTNAGAVTEETQLQTSGTLTITDIDTGEAHFSNTDIAGALGTLHLKDNGAWTYGLDNTNPTVQALGKGATATDTITVHSADGTPHQITVTVNGTNDRPTISGTSSGAVIEQGLNTAGTPDATGSLTATDLDKSDTIKWAINQPQGQWGTLSIDQNGHWHYQLDNSTGSAADKLATGEHQSESFWITATDSAGATVLHKIVIDVQGSNDKPIVSAWTQLPAGKEDQPVTIKVSDLLTHASDVDTSDILLVTNLHATHGSVTDNKDGTYTFAPDKDYNGEVRLTYRVEDTHGGIVNTQAKFDLTAAPDNAIITDAQANADLRGVTEDRGYIDTHYQLHYDGQLNIQDPDAGEAQFDPNIGPQTYQGIGYDTKLGGHVLLMRDGHYTYTLDNRNIQNLAEGEVKQDSVVIRSVDGTTHTIELTVHGTNDAPVINAQSHSVTEGGSVLKGQMVGHDIDTGATLTYSAPQIDGLVVNPDGSYSFNPAHSTYQSLASGVTKTLTVPVTVTDEHNASSTQNLSITITGVNNSAVIGGVDTGDVIEGTAGQNMSPDYAQPLMSTLGRTPLYASGALTITDADSGETTFDSRGLGFNYAGRFGDLMLREDGTWSYYADAGNIRIKGGITTNRGSAIDQLGEGEVLTDTITIYSKDGTSHDVVITIHGSNDRPYCASEVQLNSGKEDSAQTITAIELLANTVDVDANDAGKLTIANLHADHGSILDNQDGTYTFTPDKDYNGQVHFTYDVKDAHSGVTHTGATMNLAPVGDTATITGVDTGSIIEDRHVFPDSMHHIQVTGSLSVSDPDAGEDHFRATGVFGHEKAINDPFQGEMHIDRYGNWDYVLANGNPAVQALKQGETKDVIYEVQSADGTPHRITITVTGTNDAPTVTKVVLNNGTEDTHYQMQASQFGFTDVDTGDTLHSIAITDLPPAAQGKFVLDGHDVTTGKQIPAANISRLQFVPAQDFNGDVQFKYTVNDGHTDSAEATNTLHIDAVGDKAVIAGVDTGDVYENRNPDMSPDFAQPGIAHLTNSMIHVEGQLTIIDPDTGENSFDSKGIGYTYHGKYGHLILNTDGKWFYGVATGTADVNGGLTTKVGSTIDQLGANETLTDTITIQSKDGTTHDIVITIHGDNDRPYCNSEVQLNSGKEDTQVTLTAQELLANTVDVDVNDVGKLSIANLLVDHGSVIDNKDGTYTFTPTKDYNGQVHFTYDVTDAHGGTTHTGANTTLVATPDKAIISEVTTGSVIEDGPHATHNNGTTTELANGQLQVIDPDSGENKFQYSQFGETSIHDPFGGMLRIDSAGNWGYSVDNAALQHLAQGQVETVTYRVHSFDGTAYDLNIDVVGSNDTPTVTKVVLSNGTEDINYQMQASQFGFTDVDTGDTLHSIAITDLPPAAQGKFVLDGHDITAGQSIATTDIAKLQFVPATDFNGDVQFKFTVNDGHVDSQEATNTLHIDAVSDAAQFTGRDTGDVHEGHTYTAPDGSMSGGYVDDRSPDHMHGNIGKIWNDEIHTDGHLNIVDPDSGESHAQTGTYQGTHGHVILQSNGDWSYYASIGQDATGRKIDHLGQGESITDTVTVKAADGTTHDIHITIHGDNDRPYCSSEVQLNSGKEDLTQTITTTELLANTVDVDTNDAGKLSIANLHADHGTLVDNKDGTFTFTPDHNFNGKVHFTYDVKDAHGGVTHTGASATLLPSNDSATLQSTLASNFVTEDHLKSGTSTNELWSGWKNLDIQDVDSPSEAKVTQIEVNGVKHTVPANFAMNLAGAHGTFNFTHSTDGHDKWSYSADNSHTEVQSLSHGDSLTDTITLLTADGTRIPLTAKILGTDDHVMIDTPDALTAALGTAVEDKVTSIFGTLLAHDSDSKDSVIFTAGNSVGSYGTLHVDSNGQWHYDLDHSKANVLQQGETKAEGFDITAISTDGSTATKHIEVLVQGSNDKATISVTSNPDVYEDRSSTPVEIISGKLSALDPDHDQSSFSTDVGKRHDPFNSGVHGGLHISKDGSWTYTVNNSQIQQLAVGQEEHVQYNVHTVGGDSHVIDIKIVGTNDDPVLSVTQTTPTTGTLTETDVDVKDTHTFSVVNSTGQFGSLSVDPDSGAYVYTANGSVAGMSYNATTHTYHGTDMFEVKVADNHGGESSKFITFDANGHVSVVPGQSPTISTSVPSNPLVTTTQPSLPTGTNTPPNNAITVDLAASSDTGLSDTDNVTKETTPTITGHTDIPYSQVTIYDGSTPIGHAVSDGSGQYSVAVSSLSEGDHNLSAKALAPSSVLPATSSLLSVHIDTQVHVGIQTNPITADNVINAQESNNSIDITGSVSGDYNAGDIVTLDVNGTQHTGVVDAKGHYSIAVPGSELLADADQKIEASVAVTDTAGNSAHATADVTYQVDTQVSVPTITFENAGADNLYSKAEIARGLANTITATVTPPGDAKIGEHLVVNGQDHVLDAHSLQHGIQIEVHPGSNVQATMTDEHGNTAGSQGFATSAIPEPIVVRPPSGSHQVSGTLGVPPLLPSLTPVPTAQSGWRIHLPNGQYVTSHHGQYGTLTIDPQTGHLHYQEQAQVHTGPHGSASGIGQHEDKFEVALQGTNQDEVVAHVNIQILSHGPGHSGKLTVGTEVVDMTITPVVHTSHPAPPPPPPVQHDEPDMASQADFTVTLSDDSNLDLTQQTHQEPDQKTSHHGAAAYLDALGIKPDATSTTVHDQPADMDIVLAQVDQQDAVTHDQTHLDMSDALEHHDANVNHNQDDEHHHHNDVDGLPDIDPNS
ncbi:VCBS domain-containing protein, partial [Vibrio sp. 14G-20]